MHLIRLISTVPIVCALLTPAATFAQSGAGNTLNLPLETRSDPTAAPNKTVSRLSRSGKPAPSRGTLSSRGRTTRTDTALGDSIGNNAAVLGRVVVVSAEKAALYSAQDASARVLSTVPKDTYLAVVAETASTYGVLMADKSTGWVAKNVVNLLDYQVAVAAPPESAGVPTAAGTVAGASSGGTGQTDYATYLASLEPRTASLLREAFNYMGVPYVWGGNTRQGLDCSAFVKNVFSTVGVRLPRVSGDQAQVGQLVAWEDLRPGDRLYFDMGNKGRVSHTGIYIGNGYFVHASSNQKKVGVDSVYKSNYFRALVCARRD